MGTNLSNLHPHLNTQRLCHRKSLGNIGKAIDEVMKSLNLLVAVANKISFRERGILMNNKFYM